MEAAMMEVQIDKVQLGKALKAMRHVRDLTQAQAAKALGLTQSAYSMLESGYGTDANYLAAVESHNHTIETLTQWHEETLRRAEGGEL